MADQLMAGSVQGTATAESRMLAALRSAPSGEGLSAGALTTVQGLPLMGASVQGVGTAADAPLTVLTRVAPSTKLQRVKHGGKVTWEDN